MPTKAELQTRIWQLEARVEYYEEMRQSDKESVELTKQLYEKMGNEEFERYNKLCKSAEEHWKLADERCKKAEQRCEKVREMRTQFWHALHEARDFLKEKGLWEEFMAWKDDPPTPPPSGSPGEASE